MIQQKKVYHLAVAASDATASFIIINATQILLKHCDGFSVVCIQIGCCVLFRIIQR